MQTDASVIKLDINLIVPNKYQPRKVFDDNALDSLAESIKNYGIINPILVRKKDDKYEIIAGERRFRAAKRNGLTEVPVIIKNADEQQMAELALIENIQRQGLSPIEEAKSYEEIMRIGNQTQKSLAEKLGKSQSAIANKIRLLSLPEEIQDALANKKISERHARSLITIEDKDKQLELLKRITEEKLTVKETEQIINQSEINEEEIKKAISDIMKSLNIKEDEKEDDNMNNGNFFPNFDNNNVPNNNASLNMMNMQSMNQPPMEPVPEVVMPTLNQPVQEPQLIVPTAPVDMAPQMNAPEVPIMPMNPVAPMQNFEQFGPAPSMTPEYNMNNNMNSINSFMAEPSVMPQENPIIPPMPMEEQPMMNETPLFGPQFGEPTIPVDTQSQVADPEIPVMNSAMVDTPLFNPEVVMPTVDTSIPSPMPEEPQMVNPELPMMEPTSFEIPVTNPQSYEEPTAPVAPVLDRLTELQNLLSSNGYNYKVYSNNTDDCVIIELPR